MGTQPICSVDGCGKSAKSRGYCTGHYERWRITGDAQTPHVVTKNMRCAVDGCTKPPHGKYCQTHYRLQKKYGSTEYRQTPAGAARAHLDVVLAIETDDCIEWPYGRLVAGGYGRVGKDKGAHRMVCEMAHGKPFKGARACHSCGNGGCVNKRHLRWGTAKDNAEDAKRLGEYLTGDRRKSTKLTDAQVLKIERIGLGKSLSVLAAEYGVSPNAIGHIRAKRRACQRQTSQ